MRKLQWIGVALLFQIAVWGCAETKQPPALPNAAENSIQDWRSMAEASSGNSPPAQEPAAGPSRGPNDAATGRPSEKAKKEKSLPTIQVSLRMHNADTVVVLRALARSVGVNILLNEKVKGAVSVDLENVPWDQAFLGILHSEGLDYTWEGNMLRVMTAEDMVNEMKIASVRPMKIQVVPIHFADPAKLQEKLKDALTKDETGKVRGYMAYDEHTSSLVIKAGADELGKMVELVQGLDRPTAQIHIVSNIVEATKEATRSLGIQWGGFYHSGNTFVTPGGTTYPQTTVNTNAYTPFTGTSGISKQGFGVNLPAQPINGINPSSVGLMVGTIGGIDESFGIFIDQGTKAALRLKTGEDYQGWTLSEVHGREVTMQKDQRSAVLTLPQPGIAGEVRLLPPVTQVSATSAPPARPESSRRIH